MSYILDALKKSEQERGHGNIPSVQTIHTSSLNYSKKKAYWPYILIIAVLLNLLAIVYFYLNNNSSKLEPAQASSAGNPPAIEKKVKNPAARITEAVEIEPQTKSSGMEKAVSNDNEQAAAIEEPIAEEMETSMQQDESEQAITDGKDYTGVIEFDELPQSVKQQLPAIIISAHVYSTNPLQRSVVINNNFLEEGEYVLDDLILQEITEDGAILFYHGTRFHLGVVSGWQ